MAEGDNYPEITKTFYQNFQNALECPICIDVVKQPFKQCAKGHLMCVGCLGTLTSCPTCQGAFITEDPVCIKQLLELLPHHCQYSANGCKKLVENGDNHEKLCGFRYIRCRSIGCVEDILAKELLEHYNTHRKPLTIEDERVVRRCWINFDPLKKREGNIFVNLFDNLFWLSLDNDVEEKQLRIWFEAIPIRKIEKDYHVNIEIIKEKVGFRSTLKAYIPEENEPSSQGENVRINKMDQFCMKIPQMMLPHLINENGSLSIHLSFFKG